MKLSYHSMIQTSNASLCSDAPLSCPQVRAKACAILGYASLNDTALVLLATRARAAVTLPGGHLILTVTESQWFRVPLQVSTAPR